MSYANKQLLERYKTYILNTIMTFLCVTMTIALAAVFFRFTHWVFTF